MNETPTLTDIELAAIRERMNTIYDIGGYPYKYDKVEWAVTNMMNDLSRLLQHAEAQEIELGIARAQSQEYEERIESVSKLIRRQMDEWKAMHE